MRYLCDTKRHLICVPYSVENLHKMAQDLNIGKHWFHKGKSGLDHYDIPKNRIDEITAKCELVPSNEIVKIIRHVVPAPIAKEETTEDLEKLFKKLMKKDRKKK